MVIQQEKLAHLRQQAETVLKHVVETPQVTPQTIDELVHELRVYHVELELQLEELQRSYQMAETARQRYARLFDFAPVGYIETDPQGIVLRANLTASNLLGIEHGSLEKTHFAAFITTDFQDIYHLYRRAVLKTRQGQTCEVQLQRADRTIFHAQLTTDLSDPESDTLRTAITDISTLKQAEESLRRALAREKELNEIRERVLAVISHEFRTPLTIMLTSLEVLERLGDRLPDDKKQQRYQTIRNLIWYLNDTVQDARNLQAFNDLSQLKLATFDALAFLRQITEEMTNLVQGGQSIVFKAATQHETEPVTWDQKLVRRLIMNLLNNALKYSQEPVVCTVEYEEVLIRIQIIDRGRGISDADQQHMYEAFYRGTNAEFIPGIGVGLFIVQQAVQAHTGTLHCDSHMGEGTTFTVELPRHVVVPPP